MSFIESIFVYLLCWWISLFAVLPWQVKRTTKPQKGNDLGAPNEPLLLKKFIITSIIALIFTVIIWMLVPTDVSERGGIVAVLVGAS